MQYDVRPHYERIEGSKKVSLVRRFQSLYSSVQMAYLEADHKLYKMGRFTSQHIASVHEPVAKFYAMELRVRIFMAIEAGEELTANLVSSIIGSTDHDQFTVDTKVQQFKQALFLHRHCDLPSGTVNESELKRADTKLFSVVPYSVIPNFLHFFTYSDSTTKKHDRDYRHESYTVEDGEEMRILDLGDDDCICGGLAICYIQ